MFTTDYKIYPEVGLIYYSVDGATELEKVFELYDTIANDPDFSEDYKGVGDWRRASPSLSREEVVRLSNYSKDQQFSHAQWVALVDSPLLTARSFIYSQIISPQHPLEVCTTLDRASEILGIPLDPYVV